MTEKDLENTTYKFTLDDGNEIEVKGNEEIEYDGEIHSAANLYDALKEGYYGKFWCRSDALVAINGDKWIDVGAIFKSRRNENRGESPLLQKTGEKYNGSKNR